MTPLALLWSCASQPPAPVAAPAPVSEPPISEPALPRTIALDQKMDSVGTEVPCAALQDQLVSCAITQLGEGGPDQRHLFRFRLEDGRWDFLERASSPELELRGRLMEALEEAGVATGWDSELVAGLGQPELLAEGDWGKLELKYPADAAWEPQGKEVIFTHPEHGPVYGTRTGNAALYLPQPEGTYLVYSYALGDWQRSLGYAPHFARCGAGPEVYARLAPALELEPYTGELLKPRHGEDPPRFLAWKDPYGRMVELLRDDLQPAPCISAELD